MPRKRMQLPSCCFSPHRRPMPAPSSRSPQTSSATLLVESTAAIEHIITKWDRFHESRTEARQLLCAVADLQHAMASSVSDDTTAGSHSLLRAHTLIEAAIWRLESEFGRILSANRDYLDPESISARSSPSGLSYSDNDEEDEIRAADECITNVECASAVAMGDLRAIADAMISAGYGEQCVRVYKSLRKSIVDEGLYRLGFQRLTLSRVRKLDWDLLELKIKSWLGAARVAIKTLFAGERTLIDHVFAASDAVRESCFASITSESAVEFFAFPKLVVKTKRSPEKMFRMLDLYEALSDLWPEIETVFSFESTTAVRSQALTSQLKLAEAVRATLAEFEAFVQKDNSNSPVPGSGVHTLARYAINYIACLADYEPALAEIYTGFPLQLQTLLPEWFFDGAAMTPSSSMISALLAWLVLVLLCKIDGKAEVYKDVALSYLFLANNLQYVVSKVFESRLRVLLGDDWVAQHGTRARHYASNYKQLAQAKGLTALPATWVARK